MKTIVNYSPNFDLKKRNSKAIKFIIFHYTGMKSEKNAINRLTSLKSKVSCHYFVKRDGEIYKYKGCLPIPPLSMVDDILAVGNCGSDSIKLNSIIQSKMSTTKLRNSIKSFL